MRVRVFRYSKSLATGQCSRYRQVRCGSRERADTLSKEGKQFCESHSSQRVSACCSTPPRELSWFLVRSRVLKTEGHGKPCRDSMAFHARYSSDSRCSSRSPSPRDTNRLCCMSSCRNAPRASNPDTHSILFLPSHSDSRDELLSSPSMTLDHSSAALSNHHVTRDVARHHLILSLLSHPNSVCSEVERLQINQTLQPFDSP